MCSTSSMHGVYMPPATGIICPMTHLYFLYADLYMLARTAFITLCGFGSAVAIPVSYAFFATAHATCSSKERATSAHVQAGGAHAACGMHTNVHTLTLPQILRWSQACGSMQLMAAGACRQELPRDRRRSQACGSMLLVAWVAGFKDGSRRCTLAEMLRMSRSGG